MNPILRNILVTLAALFIGGLVNMAIITLMPSLIDLPDGFNPQDPASFEKYKHLLPVTMYILVLLAHGLGALVGAFIIAKWVTTKSKVFALGVGFFFLLGGIVAAFTIPAPSWFVPVDLILCYIPMAILGWILAGKRA